MQETARLFFLLFEKKKKENSHLTLGKREKEKKKRKERKEKKWPNSHLIPPWKVSKLPQECWMGMHTGNKRRLTRCPVSSFGFGPHYWLPAICCRPRKSRIDICTDQTHTWIIGEANVQNPSLQVSQLKQVRAPADINNNYVIGHVQVRGILSLSSWSSRCY